MWVLVIDDLLWNMLEKCTKEVDFSLENKLSQMWDSVPQLRKVKNTLLFLPTDRYLDYSQAGISLQHEWFILKHPRHNNLFREVICVEGCYERCLKSKSPPTSRHQTKRPLFFTKIGQ